MAFATRTEQCVSVCVFAVMIAWVVSAIKTQLSSHTRCACVSENVTKPDL